MDPKDFAIVGFYTSFSSLMTPLISFYAFNYYTKRYFECNENERLNLKATIFKALIFLSLVLALICLFGLYFYMKKFNQESSTPFLPYALLSVFSLPLIGITTLKLTDYKMQKKSFAFFKLAVGKGIVLVLMTLLFVVILKYGALGKMSATFLAAFFIFVYCLYADFDLLKKKVDWAIMKSMIKFVWPLIIGSMLHFFTNGFDRVYLERIGNQSELGFYVVAVQIVGYIGVFRVAIADTFQPDIYKAIIHRNWKNASKYIIVLLSSTFVIVIIFLIFAPFLIDLLTAGRYTYSTKYARILAFSQLTQAMYFIVTEITIVLGYSKMALINKIVGVVITVIIYSIFISKWQFIGAAWGLTTSYLVLMAVNVLFLLVWTRVKNIG